MDKRGALKGRQESSKTMGYWGPAKKIVSFLASFHAFGVRERAAIKRLNPKLKNFSGRS
jgi:hypothetical protein